MEVLRELKPNNRIAIALGYFDGIHIGHKKIINTLVQQAKLKGLKSAIITEVKSPFTICFILPLPFTSLIKNPLC